MKRKRLRKQTLFSPNRFIWLDFIRGVCAILVCAAHLRAISIVDYTGLSSASLPQKLFYFSTGLGHQSVMVFFVLSGFFVGGAALRNRHQFDLKRYLIARLTRLWIVLVPALILTSAVDLGLRTYAPDVLMGHYRTLWNSGPGLDSPYSASPATFLANIFFLQTIVTPVFGSNGPLWSLSNEFWYYMLFAAGLLLLQGHTKHAALPFASRLFLGASSLFVAALLPLGILKGFLVWCMGIVVYLSQGRIPSKLKFGVLAGGLVSFFMALVYSKIEIMQLSLGLSPDFVTGTAFCVLAIGIVNYPPLIACPAWLSYASKTISDFSFSLYLIHFPFVALIGGLFYQENKLAPDFMGISCFLLWLLSLLVLGFVFYFIFERRTNEVRQRIERLFCSQHRSSNPGSPNSDA